jgi:hypothetical protein
MKKEHDYRFSVKQLVEFCDTAFNKYKDETKNYKRV